MEDNSRQFWVLDTRPLWPGTKIDDAGPEALSILSPEEQEKARKFHFLRDAKLSVGSSALKRLFVVRSLETPWREARFARLGDARHGKPCCLLADGSPAPIDFNVSHQAGLVALAGCRASDGLVGVDIVCVNERNEKRLIEREGFEGFVDMHSEIFSPQDLGRMMRDDGPLDAKLRRFYAYWCLKEAYVKLEGEALLASWLRDIEFRNVVCPQPAAALGNHSPWGSTVEGIQVFLRGVLVDDVRLYLQAFEDNYMVGTAMKLKAGNDAPTPSYSLLDLHSDIYPWARN